MLSDSQFSFALDALNSMTFWPKVYLLCVNFANYKCPVLSCVYDCCMFVSYKLLYKLVLHKEAAAKLDSEKPSTSAAVDKQKDQKGW